MRLISAVGLLVVVCLTVEGTAITNLCSEGDTKPVANTCDHYLICVNGSWDPRRCSEPDQFFDPTALTCRDKSEVPCAGQVCSSNSVGSKAPVPQACDKYRVCLGNGQVKEETCPWFQRFDLVTESCQWWYKVDCHLMNKCSEKLDVFGSIGEYKRCMNEEFGKKCSDGEIFNADEMKCVKVDLGLREDAECSEGRLEPYPGSCSKFYRCVNGTKVEDKCWFFQRFDKETLSCDYIWNADCQIGAQCKSGDKVPSGDCREYYQCEYGFWKRRDCGTSIGLQMYFDQVSKDCMIVGSNCSDVECSVEGLKRPFPTDCSKYEICRNGRFYEESCGQMRKFDSERNDCVYFGAVCNAEQSRPDCLAGQRYSVDGSCYAYQECVGGHLETKHCFYPLYRFDKDTLSCSFMAECDTRCYDGEVKPVPGKCEQFYQCSDGQYFTLTCPHGTVFDIVTSTCEDPKLATCSSLKTDRK